MHTECRVCQSINPARFPCDQLHSSFDIVVARDVEGNGVEVGFCPNISELLDGFLGRRLQSASQQGSSAPISKRESLHDTQANASSGVGDDDDS